MKDKEARTIVCPHCEESFCTFAETGELTICPHCGEVVTVK